jgi:hypothetical protein
MTLMAELPLLFVNIHSSLEVELFASDDPGNSRTGWEGSELGSIQFALYHGKMQLDSRKG